MSIQKIIQESISGNPVEMKEAFEEEIRGRLAYAIKSKISEETEELDELSKATLGSYIKKAVDNKGVQDRYAGRTGDRESYSISNKRDQGVKRAVDKLTKEDVEQIDELSKATLASYIKKAGGTSLNSAGAYMADYGANRNAKSFKKGINRAKGVMKAADRLTKEEVELDEAGAVVTHKWYSVKHWEDGSDHFDNLDDHLHGHDYKHAALGNTSRKRPDHHIGIPVKAKSAIAYMDKHAKPIE